MASSFASGKRVTVVTLENRRRPRIQFVVPVAFSVTAIFVFPSATITPVNYDRGFPQSTLAARIDSRNKNTQGEAQTIFIPLSDSRRAPQVPGEKFESEVGRASCCPRMPVEFRETRRVRPARAGVARWGDS